MEDVELEDPVSLATTACIIQRTQDSNDHSSALDTGAGRMDVFGVPVASTQVETVELEQTMMDVLVDDGTLQRQVRSLLVEPMDLGIVFALSIQLEESWK